METGTLIDDILALNTNAEFDPQDNCSNYLQRRTFGDASESGILRFMSVLMQQRGVDLEKFKQEHPKVFEIPFNSVNKF